MAEEVTRNRAGGSGWSSASGTPCGACRFLRKKCVNGCVFAPHFSPEQGSDEFASMHKLFGASNMTKLLLRLPEHSRHNAIESLLYEAQARSADPVFGCVKYIMSLEQEVLSLQKELATVKNQLLSHGQMVANTLQGPVQQLNPVYPNGSSDYNLANDYQIASSSQPSFDQLQFSQPFGGN